jgi:hypothetical protein
VLASRLRIGQASVGLEYLLPALVGAFLGSTTIRPGRVNVLGTVNPAAEIARIARAHGATVLVDASQSAAHMKLDVGALGADFVACTAHKMLGPTGIGMLWGRRELLESMPPYQSGGDMIRSVSFEHTVYNIPPYRFEAGTPNTLFRRGFTKDSLAPGTEIPEAASWAQISSEEGGSCAAATPPRKATSTGTTRAGFLELTWPSRTMNVLYLLKLTD